MENKKGISKGILFFVVLISVVVIAVLVISFKVFYDTPKEVIKETVEAGSVSMTYADDFNGLAIVNATPVTDEVGMLFDGADQYFDFTVTTEIDDSASVDYEIAVVKKSDSTILDDNIRIYLEKQSEGSYVKVFGPEKYTALSKKSDIGSPKGSMVITKVNKKEKATDNYRLRIWLSDKAVVSPEVLQNYTVEVVISGKAK